MTSKLLGDAATNEALNIIPAEIAKRGWAVMLSGDIYNAIHELLLKLIQDGTADAQGQQFLETLRHELLHRARPYAPKNRVVPATRIPF